MKPITNWNEVKATGAFQKLPAGAYEIKILDAAEVHQYSPKNGNTYDMLEISFDISDGEFIDYYANDYRSQTTEDKKWRGVVKFFVPKGDGTPEDAKTAGKLKAAINAVEDSNTGYTWDWNEKSLKGKKVACIFRNEEWEWNGKSGMTARPMYFISVADYAQGKYTIPADKLLKKAPTPVASASSYTDLANDDDLPF